MSYREADTLTHTSDSDDESLKKLAGDESASERHAEPVSRRSRWSQNLSTSMGSKVLDMLSAAGSGAMDTDDEPLWDPVEGKRRSRDIDKYLEAEAHRMKHQFKIFLFGDLEQKDIFWKQTRLLERPLSEKERAELRMEARHAVAAACRDCVYRILDEIHVEQPPYENQTLERMRHVISNEKLQTGEMDAAVVEIYCDPAFKSAVQHHDIDLGEIERSAFDYIRSSFMTCFCGKDSSLTDALARIFAPDYEPRDHDWFHFDKRIQGPMLREARLDRGSHTIRVLDFARRSTERRKWIHMFDNMTCLVYVANLTLYDESLFEDESVNRLEEDMAVFQSVINSRTFSHAPRLLILSNITAFKEKLLVSPLSKAFPDYTGGEDEDKAVDFIRSRYRKLLEDGNHLHISATDVFGAENVTNIFETMEKTALVEKMTDLSISSTS